MFLLVEFVNGSIMSSQLGGFTRVAMEPVVCDIFSTIGGLCLQCYQHHSWAILKSLDQ